MFSENKVTEIFYLADEFCKFLMLNKKNRCLKPLMTEGSIVVSPIG